MSYDIHLLDPVTKKVIEFDEPHQLRGGTYQVGGSREAWINVTYNYSKHIGRVLPGGIRSIYGKTGAESIPLLEAAAVQLSDEVDPDYWTPTEGNVKRALYQILALARIRPDGVWDGD